MRKTLVLLAILAFAAIPALAQHNGHGSGNHSNSGHAQAQPRHDSQGRGVMRDDHIKDKRSEKQFHEQHGNGGYHYGVARGDARAHWNGRHFDHEFFESHWGYGHRFYWNHCGWYGRAGV